jgi:rod shape determining protein RodA
MIPWRRVLREGDPVLAISIAVLLVIGILAVYSATLFQSGSAPSGLYWKQGLWLFLGIAACAAAALVPFRVYDGLAYWIYGGALLLVFAVTVMGSVGLGAKRWIDLGPIRLQPSEVMKIGLVVALARYLSGSGVDLSRARFLLLPLGLTAVPTLFVLKQPDLGTAMALVVVLLAMLYWAGLPALFLFVLVSPALNMLATFWLPAWILFAALLLWILYRSKVHWMAVIVLVVAHVGISIVTPRVWGGLEGYQRERILTFLAPDRDPSGAGYQIIQSKIAIGSGGWAGKGFLQGTQKALSFLPHQHTDFIFSVLGEEFGFLGVIVVLGLFTLVLIRGIGIARGARSRFGSLLAAGAVAVFAYHVGVNVSMTVGLAPVTGLPLPFLSYGGSFLIVCMTMAGLLLNVAVRRNER